MTNKNLMDPIVIRSRGPKAIFKPQRLYFTDGGAELIKYDRIDIIFNDEENSFSVVEGSRTVSSSPNGRQKSVRMLAGTEKIMPCGFYDYDQETKKFKLTSYL